jgi:hypothetical protein
VEGIEQKRQEDRPQQRADEGLDDFVERHTQGQRREQSEGSRIEAIARLDRARREL